MSIIAPTTPSTSRAPRSRWLAAGLAIYVVSLAAALASANVWLEAFAAWVLVSLLLSPGLRRRSLSAWTLWLLGGAGFFALAARGHGRLALDVLPILVNAALCLLFARTLAHGREPLIARIIEVLEGRERLALPRVAAYARGLTLAWALLLGAQAALLALLLTFTRPDGLLDALGVAPSFAVAGTAWRWYLHVGSYALVLTFLVLEYAFRRRYLAHLPHAPMAQFIARLMRRWPALVRRLADETD